jgi:putative transposase
LGLILGVVVTGADTPERDGGEDVLIDIKGLYHRLKKIWADGGYTGDDFEKAARRLGREIEIVKRSDDAQGFEVLPKRWIVERTFAWLGRYRRLSKDYESLVASSIAMIQIAMTNLMLHRLIPG